LELKAYWKILRRRWWAVVGLTLAAGIVSYFMSPQAQAGFQASFRLVVSVAPEARTGNYFTYDQYYNWVASDYLVDDLTEIVKSQSFVDEVRREMGGDARVAIPAAYRAQKVHRILTISVSALTSEDAQALGKAAAQVLEAKGPAYLAPLENRNVAVRIIDPPAVVAAATGRSYLDLGLRTGLGLLAGLVAAFLLHYLDDRIYERSEVEHLGLAVLGEIPPS